MRGVLSAERMGLWFTTVAGPRQCIYSWVRVLQDPWPYFTASKLRLPRQWATVFPVQFILKLHYEIQWYQGSKIKITHLQGL
jgi:hypothetical protein